VPSDDGRGKMKTLPRWAGICAMGAVLGYLVVLSSGVPGSVDLPRGLDVPWVAFETSPSLEDWQEVLKPDEPDLQGFRAEALAMAFSYLGAGSAWIFLGILLTRSTTSKAYWRSIGWFTIGAGVVAGTAGLAEGVLAFVELSARAYQRHAWIYPLASIRWIAGGLACLGAATLFPVRLPLKRELKVLCWFTALVFALYGVRAILGWWFPFFWEGSSPVLAVGFLSAGTVLLLRRRQFLWIRRLR
jgi:hypothetical protein